MELINRLRDEMQKEELKFAYRGLVTLENSVPLIMLIEREMETAEYGPVARKRLFMFVVESLQNVAKHGDDAETSGMSLILYSKISGGYSVTTGNVISSDNVDDLRKRLDEINRLAPDEIRSVYRRMLTDSSLSSKGGAGLGLIEMAKKTGNRLDYDFRRLNDRQHYFMLNKTVDSEGTGFHTDSAEKHFNGDKALNLGKMMARNDIYLIWSGHLNHAVGREVISFTEKKLSEENIEQTLRKRVFSILVEMIENVAKYSPGREDEEKYGMPLAILRFREGVYHISTGNLIRNSKTETLRGKMDIISGLDNDELRQHFKKSLAEQTPEVESTGNMGLIEMAWKSGNKLHYRLSPLNDIYSYFTITARIDSQV
ncbi:MAG: hypothetical protein GX158_06005 [Bacteroidales bacterium]|nr:hypothetical protein [Bacteroidales bacterium]